MVKDLIKDLCNMNMKVPTQIILPKTCLSLILVKKIMDHLPWKLYNLTPDHRNSHNKWLKGQNIGIQMVVTKLTANMVSVVHGSCPS